MVSVHSNPPWSAAPTKLKQLIPTYYDTSQARESRLLEPPWKVGGRATTQYIY
jgi:hypothetical protein